MDKKQYNNVIDWTLKHEAQAQSKDSLQVTRTICNELGVALPQGDLAQVAEVLATDDYMGWKACTKEEAQEAANNGIPAIGISNDQIVMLAAEDEDQPVANAVAVMMLEENNASYVMNGTQYYVYGSGSTTIWPEDEQVETEPRLTADEYYEKITNTPLRERNGEVTYCNIWAHDVLEACGVPYATGGCTSELQQYENGRISGWYEINFQDAQRKANAGYPTIGIEPYHQVIVTPNHKKGTGNIPSVISDVWISQSGYTCFYDESLSNAWVEADWPKVRFFSYLG